MNHGVEKSKVGIIGEGQLALMLSESLEKLGHSFLCFSQQQTSPMHTFYPSSVTNDLKRFRDECNVFSLENEFHSVVALREMLHSKSEKLFPDLDSYSHFADKISQRNFYASLGISSPKWMPLRNSAELAILKSSFSFPFILKTSKGGYDGKGVRFISHESDFLKALEEYRFDEGNELLVEEKVDIAKEVAQGFLRDKEGHYTLLPLVETIQDNGICNLVLAPARVSDQVKSQIESFLQKMIKKGLVGIFNFEFFVDKNDKVIINEGAPRTHNSQHLTMDASTRSQFDLLALYLTGAEKMPEKILASPSLMVNILGKRSGEVRELTIPDFPEVKVTKKLYGKLKSSQGRKMGHVNVVDAEGRHDLLSIGRKILKEYDL